MAATLALALAGCTEDQRGGVTVPVDVPDDTRDPGEFWMVWVHGNETRRQTGGLTGSQAMCSIVFSHVLDRAARTLDYSERSYDFDPQRVQVMVAFDHWERPSDCPLAYELVADPASLTMSMGRYGSIELAVEPDGDLILDGEEVPLGTAKRISYVDTSREGASTYRHEGTFTVENLGAWPSSSLVPR